MPRRIKILAAILWLIIGWWGFVYWWTVDSPYTKSEVPMSIGVSLTGPFSWFMGYSIHGDGTIIEKKEEK